MTVIDLLLRTLPASEIVYSHLGSSIHSDSLLNSRSALAVRIAVDRWRPSEQWLFFDAITMNFSSLVSLRIASLASRTFQE